MFFGKYKKQIALFVCLSVALIFIIFFLLISFSLQKYFIFRQEFSSTATKVDYSTREFSEFLRMALQPGH